MSLNSLYSGKVVSLIKDIIYHIVLIIMDILPDIFLTLIYRMYYL
ncbi:hypothetical protein CLU96_1454 [Chryseobacterium sp. 52]|nr:hypothetical protein CLU96_1454 [Chryseobacterium sp. 52]